MSQESDSPPPSEIDLTQDHVFGIPSESGIVTALIEWLPKPDGRLYIKQYALSEGDAIMLPDRNGMYLTEQIQTMLEFGKLIVFTPSLRCLYDCYRIDTRDQYGGSVSYLVSGGGVQTNPDYHLATRKVYYLVGDSFPKPRDFEEVWALHRNRHAVRIKRITDTTTEALYYGDIPLWYDSIPDLIVWNVGMVWGGY